MGAALICSLNRLLEAMLRVSSRSAELKQASCVPSVSGIAERALLSLTHLLPRILVGHWAVLELLAAQEDILIVLLAVLPELLVVYAVATCTLQGLHG